MKKDNAVNSLFFLFFLIVLAYPSMGLHAEEQKTLTSDRPIGPNAEKAPSITLSKTFGEEIPDWKARWELAKLLSYVKRYDESLAEYQKLLKEKPDLVEAKAEMARVMFWSGKREQALKLFEDLPPDKIDEKTMITMADLYTAQKRYDRAESIYRKYLSARPDSHEIRLKLAEMLSWMKRYDESIEQYRVILKAKPDDIQVRRKYAFVLIWAGKQADAIEELQKTLDR